MLKVRPKAPGSVSQPGSARHPVRPPPSSVSQPGSASHPVRPPPGSVSQPGSASHPVSQAPGSASHHSDHIHPKPPPNPPPAHLLKKRKADAEDAQKLEDTKLDDMLTSEEASPESDAPLRHSAQQLNDMLTSEEASSESEFLGVWAEAAEAEEEAAECQRG